MSCGPTVLHFQERPCSPRASTLAPHGQIWVSHRLRPSLRPTAIVIIIIIIIIIFIIIIYYYYYYL